MRVTKREVIFSSLFVLLYVFICLLITFSIKNNYVGKNDAIYRAPVITSQERFEYALSTNKGLCFTYADIKNSDTICFEEIANTNDILYMERVEEHYNSHTRTELCTVDGKTCTRTVTHYSWDYYSTDTLAAKKLIINDIEISTDLIDLASYRHSVNVQERYIANAAVKQNLVYVYNSNYICSKPSVFEIKKRWYYRAVYLSDLYEEGNTSVKAVLKDGTLEKPNDGKIKISKCNPEELKKKSMKSPIGWIVLTWYIGAFVLITFIIGFWAIDNRWLENKE